MTSGAKLDSEFWGAATTLKQSSSTKAPSHESWQRQAMAASVSSPSVAQTASMSGVTGSAGSGGRPVSEGSARRLSQPLIDWLLQKGSGLNIRSRLFPYDQRPVARFGARVSARVA